LYSLDSCRPWTGSPDKECPSSPQATFPPSHHEGHPSHTKQSSGAKSSSCAFFCISSSLSLSSLALPEYCPVHGEHRQKTRAIDSQVVTWSSHTPLTLCHIPSPPSHLPPAHSTPPSPLCRPPLEALVCFPHCTARTTGPPRCWACRRG